MQGLAHLQRSQSTGSRDEHKAARSLERRFKIVDSLFVLGLLISTETNSYVHVKKCSLTIANVDIGEERVGVNKERLRESVPSTVAPEPQKYTKDQLKINLK